MLFDKSLQMIRFHEQKPRRMLLKLTSRLKWTRNTVRLSCNHCRHSLADITQRLYVLTSADYSIDNLKHSSGDDCACKLLPLFVAYLHHLYGSVRGITVTRLPIYQTKMGILTQKEHLTCHLPTFDNPLHHLPNSQNRI